jgi:hypothetical protein
MVRVRNKTMGCVKSNAIRWFFEGRTRRLQDFAALFFVIQVNRPFREPQVHEAYWNADGRS